MRAGVVILGPTGAGKSQQAQELAAATGMAIIGTGKLLRATGDAALIELLNRGELADTQLVQRLVAEELKRHPVGQPVILDGFPRNMDEAQWLDAGEDELGLIIVAVLTIEVEQRTALARISSRGRSDDSADSFAQKWEIYQRAVEPVIRHYDEKQLLHVIDGDGTMEEVAERIEEVLDDVELA